MPEGGEAPVEAPGQAAAPGHADAAAGHAEAAEAGATMTRDAEPAPPPPQRRVGASVLELVSARYDALGLPERAAALLHARAAGKAAAASARSRGELETGPADAYFRQLMAAAAEEGRLADDVAEFWKQACDDGAALRDPRVQAFLFGWHERATEILAEIEADDDPDDPARAKWFLESLKP